MLSEERDNILVVAAAAAADLKAVSTHTSLSPAENSAEKLAVLSRCSVGALVTEFHAVPAGIVGRA